MSVFEGSRQLIARSRELMEETVAHVDLGMRPSASKRKSAVYMRIKEQPDAFDEYISSVQSTWCCSIWWGIRAHEEKACLLNHVIEIYQRTTTRIEKSPPWQRLKRLHDLKCSMHMYGDTARPWLAIFSEVITEVFDPVPSLEQTERMCRGLQDIVQTVCGPGEQTVGEWAKKYFTQVNLHGSASRQSLCADHSKTFKLIRSKMRDLQQEFEDCFILKCVLDAYSKDFRHGRGHALTASWEFTLEEIRKGELLAWTAIGVQMTSMVENEQLELKSTLFGSNHLREASSCRGCVRSWSRRAKLSITEMRGFSPSS